MAIHDRPDRIAVYRFTPRGFAREPMATLPAKPDWGFQVVDVDGDHRADLVVNWVDHASDPAAETTRVYLTRGGLP